MYTLLKGLYSYIHQKNEYSILILGLDNAGKTTYLEQAKAKFNKNYNEANLNKITTTVGLNIGSIDIANVKLNFWDLGGQQELQSLWDKYYSESHALIYIIDSSDTDRFDESKIAFEKMIKNQILLGVPLMILANKQDLPGAASVYSIRQLFSDSYNLIGHRDCTVKGVSALKGYLIGCGILSMIMLLISDGILESINWCAEKVKQNSNKRPPVAKELIF